ncbi:hypothetical protein BS47DRAFT_1340396, partial [Hydnum rufescens UP504]
FHPVIRYPSATVTPLARFLHPRNPPNPSRSHNHTEGPRGSAKGYFARTLRRVTLKVCPLHTPRSNLPRRLESTWRNQDSFFNGRESIIEPLTKQWEKEMN